MTTQTFISLPASATLVTSLMLMFTLVTTISSSQGRNICNITDAASTNQRAYLGEGRGSVLCDTAFDGGGWILIQQKKSGYFAEKVNFNRYWMDYVNGFGYLDMGGEFWLGLENLHHLCQVRCELRIEFFGFNQRFYITYGTFIVAGEYDNFKLTLKNFQEGTPHSSIQDALQAGYTSGDQTVNGMQFSTKDKDNDRKNDENCAETFGGGWWYNLCGKTNLNGGNEQRTMFWLPHIRDGQKMDSVKMKVRPVYADWSKVDTSGLAAPTTTTETATTEISTTEQATSPPPEQPADCPINYVSLILGVVAGIMLGCCCGCCGTFCGMRKRQEKNPNTWQGQADPVTESSGEIVDVVRKIHEDIRQLKQLVEELKHGEPGQVSGDDTTSLK